MSVESNQEEENMLSCMKSDETYSSEIIGSSIQMKGKRRSKLKMPLKKIPKRKQTTLTQQINLCQDIGHIDLSSALIVSSVQKTNENTKNLISQKLLTSANKTTTNTFSILSSNKQQTTIQNRLTTSTVQPLVSIVSSPIKNTASTITKMQCQNSNCPVVSKNQESSDNFDTKESVIDSSISISSDVSSIFLPSSSSNSYSNGLQPNYNTKSTWLQSQVFIEPSNISDELKDEQSYDINLIGNSNDDINKCSQNHLRIKQIQKVKQNDLLTSAMKTIKPFNKTAVTKILHLPNRKIPINSKSNFFLKTSNLTTLNNNYMNDERLPVVHIRAPVLQPISPESNKKSMTGTKKSLSTLNKDSMGNGSCAASLNQLSGIKRRKMDDKIQKENREPYSKKMSISSRKSPDNKIQQMFDESSDDDDVIITGVMSISDLEKANALSLCENRKQKLLQNKRNNDKQNIICSTNENQSKTVNYDQNLAIDHSTIENLSNDTKQYKNENFLKLGNDYYKIISDNNQNNNEQNNNKTNNLSIDNNLKKSNIGLSGVKNANKTSSTDNRIKTYDNKETYDLKPVSNIHEYKYHNRNSYDINENGSGTDSGNEDDVLKDLGEFLRIPENKRLFNRNMDNIKHNCLNKIEQNDYPFKLNKKEIHNSTKNSQTKYILDHKNKTESYFDELLKIYKDENYSVDNLNLIKNEILNYENRINKTDHLEFKNIKKNEFNQHSTNNIKNDFYDNTLNNNRYIYKQFDNDNGSIEISNSINNYDNIDSFEYNIEITHSDNRDRNFTDKYHSSWHSFYDNFPKIPINKQKKSVSYWKRFLFNDNDPLLTDTDHYKYQNVLKVNDKIVRQFEMEAGYIIKSDFDNYSIGLKKRIYKKKDK